MDYLTHEEKVASSLNQEPRNYAYVNEVSKEEEDSLTAGRREIERATHAIEEAALNLVSTASKVSSLDYFATSLSLFLICCEGGITSRQNPERS